VRSEAGEWSPGGYLRGKNDLSVCWASCDLEARKRSQSSLLNCGGISRDWEASFRKGQNMRDVYREGNFIYLGGGRRNSVK